jgi:uroporphyrinogen-III synthase
LAPVADASSLQSLAGNLANYDWILFTSANAVERFWAEVGTDVAELVNAETKIAAVGPATQAALQKRSLAVNAMPEDFEGIKIIDVLGDVNGKRLLLPRSAKGADELPAKLSALGATVDVISLYEPLPATIDEASRQALVAGVDCVTFASGSAVHSFIAALKDDGRFNDFWSKVVIACIGPITANVAAGDGLTVQVVATEHTVAGLVAALVEFYQKGL